MSAASRRWGWGLALAFVLGGSLALRLWGIKQGLPYAFNTDENNHFVRQAIAFSNHDLNPHYFSNPPAFTYLLHIVFAVWFGGRAALSRAFATDPTTVFVVGRATAAVLGMLSVWLLYVTGKRLIDRRVGLLAAALLGVAFLPVFYAHLALNDAPTLAPITLSLAGTAGVLRFGRPVDYLVAGIGLGFACATKYTGGIVVVPLAAAAATQYLAPGGQRSALAGLVLAGLSAVAMFLIANPYSVLDWATFSNNLQHQSTVAGDSAGKLGLTHRSGILFYLDAITWGLGWVPALAAVGGAVALWWDERRLVVLLVPPALLFLLFMGLQGRYFGRWLMPILPILCVLGAYGVLELADWGGRLRPALRPTLVALAVVALLAQGLVHSVHSGLILSRADTRNLARDWMVAHVPVGTKVVVEPVVPDEWAQDPGHPSPLTANGNRWIKFSTSRSNVASDGSTVLGAGPIVNIEDYERTLRPDLIPAYEKAGFCWIVSGSTQSGRAAAAPGQVPSALAYYAALNRVATVAYRASPFSGHENVPFDFDFTFDYYPLSYHRPGPVMTIYHLTGGGCAGH
jgi:hypothetical protein